MREFRTRLANKVLRSSEPTPAVAGRNAGRSGVALRRLSLVQSAALILPVVPVLYGFCDDAC